MTSNAMLNINLQNVPDKVPVVPPGEYNASVDSVKWQDAIGQRAGQDSVELTILEGPNKGRKLFDGFPPEYMTDVNGGTMVRLGHLAKSAGITDLANFKMLDLVGKSVKVVVINKVYVDKNTQQQATAANVKDYVYKA